MTGAELYRVECSRLSVPTREAEWSLFTEELTRADAIDAARASAAVAGPWLSWRVVDPRGNWVVRLHRSE